MSYLRIRNFENRAFLFFVILTTLVFLWMIRAFLMPVFWAAVLAILMRPVYVRSKIAFRGNEPLAAAFTTLMATLLIAIPISLLVTAIVRQALAIYQAIIDGRIDLQAPIDFAERNLPRVTDYLGRFGVDIDGLRTSIEATVITVSSFIAAQALSVGQATLTITILFILTLYFFFFFVRDGDRIVEGAIRALPLGDARERLLFKRFADVSRAALRGTLVIAAIQGAIGGVMFWIVGIEGAVFWGSVMGILSLLPVVGAFLVWAPAAIYFIVTGTIWKAVFLIVGGSIAIGLMDNILRPILVGRETRMPDYFVLLATLGGLTVFGISGLVIGPIIASLFLVLWQMFADEYAQKSPEAAANEGID
jgi:predicted PurR-regulated permease PerM